MTAPIIVTGAAGFAGSHVVDLLEEDRAPVIAWRRPGGKAPRTSSARVEWAAVDLLDRGAVRAAIGEARPQAIYHCAGAPQVATSWDRTGETLVRNVLATHHVLEAVRELAPACRVLVPGSSMVYGASDRPLAESDPIAPANPYGISKLAQEALGLRAAREDGLAVVLTRSFNHFGPRQEPSFVASSFARQIARIEAGLAPAVLEVGNVDTRRDLTDVRDTVRAYRALIARARPGTVYNVCTGRAVAIRDLLRLLVSRSGVRVEIRVDPARLRPNDPPLVVGDPSRVRDEIGWTPMIPLEQTLTDLLDYWRAELRAGDMSEGHVRGTC